MTHRRLLREMDCGEFAEWMAVYLVEAEPAPRDAEETLRAELTAKAVAGVRARKAARKGKRRR